MSFDYERALEGILPGGAKFVRDEALAPPLIIVG